jgi:alkanesulfonate monooxygenase SsuD/methylene tetrahydromethanopterin reductase-like flavin-dependent oxidoreductase (luciferase family)
MTHAIELGIDTFGDVTIDEHGQPMTHAPVLRHVLAQAVLADQVGIHCIGVGEHHRPDFSVSAPEVMLAVIAGQTAHIRLYGTQVAPRVKELLNAAD